MSSEKTSLALSLPSPSLSPRYHHHTPVRTRLTYTYLREANQVLRFVSYCNGAFKLYQHYPPNAGDVPLRVFNGIGTQSSSMITVAARDNVRLSTTEFRLAPKTPLLCGGHPEKGLKVALKLSQNNRPLPDPKRIVTNYDVEECRVESVDPG